jgi:hypothetical protein
MIHNFDSTCSSSSLHSLIFGFQEFISIFFQSWEFGGLFKYTNVVLALWLFKANMEEEFGAAAGVVAVMGDSAAMGSSAAAASAMTLSESSDCTNPKEDVCAAAVIKSGNEGSGLLSSSPSCCWLILKTSDKHWAATSISSLSTPGAACTELRNWRKDLTTRRVRGESVLKLSISISCVLPFLVLSCIVLY